MRSSICRMSMFVVALVVMGGTADGQEKKTKKSPLPDTATWELKAFDSLFRVVKTEYDSEAKRAKWTVETREGYRTKDFTDALARRPFTFHFLDSDRNELAVIELSKDDFEGLPKERLMRARTQLTIKLTLPNAMPRTKKVVLQRGMP